MNNGNTNLSESARKAVQRIRVLQVLHERTGFSTQREQFDVLMSLGDQDCLAVAETISKIRKGASDADPRR